MATAKAQTKKEISTIGTAVNAPELEQELRDLMHIEVQKKSKACSNPTFECSIPRIEGYDYCIRHILRDPFAPYKQCGYVYQNGKKCVTAVLKHDTKIDPALTTYCFEHSRLVQLNKTRNTIGKFKRIESNEAVLCSISHHLSIEDSSSKLQACELDEEIDVVSPNERPFVNYDQISSLETIGKTIKGKKRILDYASDSSSDEEVVVMNNTSKTHEWNSSDNESVDSQDDDLLKHAGIYTRQEAVLISEQKLTKLQGLYITQINRLQHVLKEKRRRYLHAIRKERETLCSIHDQVKESAKERKLYEKLKALSHYHKRHGVEAVLYKKFKEKRSKTTEGYVQKGGPLFVKCIFTEGGVKCGDKALPSCKFCKKHILDDKKQILFRSCAVEKNGVVCQEPVPNIFEESTCVLHIQLPTKHQYMQKKYESETEDDDDVNCIAVASAIKVDDDVHKATSSYASGNACEQMDGIQTTEDTKNNVTISHDNLKDSLHTESHENDRSLQRSIPNDEDVGQPKLETDIK